MNEYIVAGSADEIDRNLGVSVFAESPVNAAKRARSMFVPASRDGYTVRGPDGDTLHEFDGVHPKIIKEIRSVFYES